MRTISHDISLTIPTRYSCPSKGARQTFAHQATVIRYRSLNSGLTWPGELSSPAPGAQHAQIQTRPGELRSPALASDSIGPRKHCEQCEGTSRDLAWQAQLAGSKSALRRHFTGLGLASSARRSSVHAHPPRRAPLSGQSQLKILASSACRLSQLTPRKHGEVTQMPACLLASTGQSDHLEKCFA
jgi:hypothetical protein